MKSLSAALLLAAVAARAASNACATISSSISANANVYWPDSTEYTLATEHWLLSSIEEPQCVVEPSSAADISVILNTVNATRTPFAIKGGGHTSNRGFSSTTGVHISLARFNYTTLDVSAETVTIGAGTKWISVYTTLNGTGFNVVGGRNPAVGVAGLTLGGGYSWKTNAHGLTIDNLLQVSIVLPNGTATRASAVENENLFFALKGGFNNFGVVTEFIFRAVPQDLVWASRLSYDAAHLADVNAAIVAFEQKNTDTRAAVVSSITALPAGNGTFSAPFPAVQLFYDGPEFPEGMFADFFAIPTIASNWAGPITFLKWSGGDGGVSSLRGVFNAFSTLPHTSGFLQDVADEVSAFSAELGPKSAAYLSVAIEPFMANSLSNENSASSAYPPVRSPVLLPSNIFFGYTDATQDDTFHKAIAQIQANIIAKAIYANYALAGTDGVCVLAFYGAAHLAKMRKVQAEVDLHGVMKLAGGWKV
ncbi:FAD-binding domain-containing protein [Mycena rebaudengoi]|nr:FAD-binding domain-containing protein [Mycena rebaudengoi]